MCVETTTQTYMVASSDGSHCLVSLENHGVGFFGHSGKEFAYSLFLDLVAI